MNRHQRTRTGKIIFELRTRRPGVRIPHGVPITGSPMVIRLFFYAPGIRRRVRRLCLAARRAAWYNTCSFWKCGRGCLPFITLQGVCHVDKKTGRRRACRPAGALRAAGRGCSPTQPGCADRRCCDPHVPRLHRRRSGHRLPVHAGVRVCASAQRPAGRGLYVRRLCRSDRICCRKSPCSSA